MQGNLGRNIPQPQGMPPGMPQGIASLQGMQRPQQPQQGQQGLQNIPQDLQNLTAAQAALSAAQQAKQVYEQALRAAADRNNAMNAQIPQGTIAEQIQTQLSDIAKQAAGVAQKQEQDKQQAMQRLMSGIAQAPGAGQVMPARMASGGIVAFQNRGEVPPTVDPREVQRILRKSPMARTPEENEILRQSGIQLEQRRMGPEGIVQRAERGLQQIGPAARQYLTEGAAGLSPEELEQRSDTGAITEKIYRMLGGQQARQPAPGMNEADLQDLMPTRQPLPQTPLPPEMGLEEPPQAPPSVTGPGLRGPAAKPPAAPGIVGALQQPPLPKPPEGGIAVQPKPTPSFEEFMKGKGDPEAARKARAAEAANVYGLSPEEKAFYEERIERMRGEMQPKETRWYERLGDLAAQMGPASSTIAGTLGGVARTGRTMQLDEQARRQKQQEQLDALRKEMLGGARTGRVQAFESGIGAEKAAMEQQGRLGQIDVGLKNIEAQREATAERASTAQEQIRSAERLAAQRANVSTELQQKIELFKKDPETYKAMFVKPEKDLAFNALKEQADILTKRLTGPIPLTGQDKQLVEAELAKVQRALSQISGVGGAAAKTMTMADVKATAKARGVSEQEVMNRAKAAGYTIQ